MPTDVDVSALPVGLRERQASALASGALEPLETELHELEDAGVRFAVREIVGSRRAAHAAPPGGGDPFLPFEEALHVGDVGEDHVCLLNKYPVVRGHVLLVTRAFEEQESPLEVRHFEALWAALGALGGLAFYNAGALAGASQRHRHFQIVPTPLHRGPRATPIEPLLDEARFGGAVGGAPALPFLHALARLRACQARAPAEAARVLHGIHREMARAFGCERPGRPYNLLVTREWMLFVPRAAAGWEGLPVNALGFAGALLARDARALERLHRRGPMALLRHAGVAPLRAPERTSTR